MQAGELNKSFKKCNVQAGVFKAKAFISFLPTITEFIA